MFSTCVCLTDSFFLSFEYASHDLSGLLSEPEITFSMAHVACIMTQLLKAMMFCDLKNIVYCDIRPANVLVTSRYISFLDFP